MLYWHGRELVRYIYLRPEKEPGVEVSRIASAYPQLYKCEKALSTNQGKEC